MQKLSVDVLILTWESDLGIALMTEALEKVHVASVCGGQPHSV